MLQNRIYVHEENPSPAETEFRNCNFARQQPRSFDEQGKPVPVRIWPNDDTPRRLVDCNCTNCEFGPNVELVGCAHVMAEYGIALGGDVEVEVDGETIAVPRTGTRVHGKWNPLTRQVEWLETPVEIDDIAEVRP